jgi:hypothetical protein
MEYKLTLSGSVVGGGAAAVGATAASTAAAMLHTPIGSTSTTEWLLHCRAVAQRLLNVMRIVSSSGYIEQHMTATPANAPILLIVCCSIRIAHGLSSRSVCLHLVTRQLAV